MSQLPPERLTIYQDSGLFMGLSVEQGERGECGEWESGEVVGWVSFLNPTAKNIVIVGFHNLQPNLHLIISV